jgi:fructose-1,6-bisphosphatase/inositol monophosphatase family enzyme
VQTLSTAFLSCELNHFDPPASVGGLLQRARGVRAYGCASQAMTMVATGALDVHVDLRGRLTPENFLAAALILEESGGCIVNPDGQPLQQIDSLISKTNLIAAATTELAQEVVDALVELSRSHN